VRFCRAAPGDIRSHVVVHTSSNSRPSDLASIFQFRIVPSWTYWAAGQRRDTDASRRRHPPNPALGTSRVASSKERTSIEPDRRFVGSHFILLNPPPAIESERKWRHCKQRHLAQSRFDHRVFMVPQPAATSSRISVLKKSKPRTTTLGHQGTLTHKFVASGNWACIYMSDKNAFICHQVLKRHIYVE